MFVGCEKPNREPAKEYYERIRDNDNTRILPGLGGVFNIQCQNLK